jgi:DNA-binding transcriptional ArsR family regulator
VKSSNSKNKTLINETHLRQISVLRILSGEIPTVSAEPKAFQIDEIAELGGLDERETQRHLFILEGQKLVSPQPIGDFTSKTWQITRNGIRALKTFERSSIQ